MKKQGKSNGGLSDRMPLTAYASLKTVHWTVFRAFGAPRPPSGKNAWGTQSDQRPEVVRQQQAGPAVPLCVGMGAGAVVLRLIIR